MSISVPKVSVKKPNTIKTLANKTPSTPKIKNSGLQGYLKTSKMQPLIKTVKSQLMS